MEAMFNLFGIVVQAGGVGLLAVLTWLLSRSIGRSYLRDWSAAWGCLAAALAALYLSFVAPAHAAALQAVYFFGEYLFGFLLVAGCRDYVAGSGRSPIALWWLAPAAALALSLGHWSVDLTARFAPQAAAMAALFGWALLTLRPALREPRRRLGLRITVLALALLTALFGLHALMMLRSALTATPLPLYYRAYISIYNLLLEVLLGFGLVTLVMEDVHHRLEQANHELARARDGLQRLAHLDPLTKALNRHAFESMLQQGRGPRDQPGSVALADIDNLKPINDAWGHAAGDAAIRAVATAIRSVLRADDPLFRWGGDEFLVVLPGLAEAEARARLAPLLDAPQDVSLPDAAEAVTVQVSFGVAAMASLQQIEAAIEAADAEMYRRKQARKKIE